MIHPKLGKVNLKKLTSVYAYFFRAELIVCVLKIVALQKSTKKSFLENFLKISINKSISSNVSDLSKYPKYYQYQFFHNLPNNHTHIHI